MAFIIVSCLLSLFCAGAGAASQEPVAHSAVFGLPLRNLAALESTFWRIADPADAQHLKHRSTAELKDLIGADASSLARATDWLKAEGAVSIEVSALADAITAGFPATTRSGDPISIAGLRRKALKRGGRRKGGNTLFDFVIEQAVAATTTTTTTTTTAATATAAVSSPSPPSATMGSYTIGNMKKAYGIPTDLAATHPNTTSMVWGPGTFGYSKTQLGFLKLTQCPKLNMNKVKFDTANHGQSGGDNYGEGNLDTQMISSFGLNATIVVSNTNTSSSTEEGKGFGEAMLLFLTSLASRPALPQVLSLSLGSLSAYSCDILCDGAVKKGFDRATCESFLQDQRQVCMFMDQAQDARISVALQVLGTRGVTVFGSSGDGGSHFSFQPFNTFGSHGDLAKALNDISCAHAMPVYPTGSPYITSVGGTDWSDSAGAEPKAWSGSGGGFAWQFPAAPHQAAAVKHYLSAAAAAGLPPAASFNASARAYPDVSAVAVAGTNQSSPIMAGIFTLIADARLRAGLPNLGFLGPRLYKAMAAGANDDDAADADSKPFQDVTTGNTKTSCDQGFAALKGGWDPVTGWGRPNWAGLVKYFASDDALPALALA